MFSTYCLQLNPKWPSMILPACLFIFINLLNFSYRNRTSPSSSFPRVLLFTAQDKYKFRIMKSLRGVIWLQEIPWRKMNNKIKLMDSTISKSTFSLISGRDGNIILPGKLLEVMVRLGINLKLGAVWGRISPLEYLSNINRKRTGGIKAMISDLFH